MTSRRDTSTTDDDDAIAARLRAAPRSAWQAFREAVVDWRDSDDPTATWPEMETAGTTDSGQPILVWPHPTYSRSVMNVVEALGRLGVVVVFDWMRADLEERYPRGAGLAGAPVAEAARLATTFIRAERFSDGAIGSAVDQGYFDAVIDRLVVFAEDEGL